MAKRKSSRRKTGRRKVTKYKADFIREQMREHGRSKKQAEATYKMVRGSARHRRQYKLNPRESKKAIVGKGAIAQWSRVNQAWIVRPYNPSWPKEVVDAAPVLAIVGSRDEARHEVGTLAPNPDVIDQIAADMGAKSVVRSNPLKRGWSRPVVSDNISLMMHEGYAQDQAVAASLDNARRSYRDRHPRKALPAHLRRRTPNPGGKVLGQIGDINATDHGGGVVYNSPYGPMLEYTYGLETDHPGVEGTDDEVEGLALTVYHIDLGATGLEFMRDFDWVDWGAVAGSIDMDESELVGYARSSNPMARASVAEAIAGYYGWHELDHQPGQIRYGDLDARWYPGGYLAKSMGPEQYVN